MTPSTRITLAKIGNGWGNRTVGSLLGVSHAVIGKWERGVTRPTGRDLLAVWSLPVRSPLGRNVRWRDGDVVHEGRVIYLDGEWVHSSQKVDAILELDEQQLADAQIIVRVDRVYAGKTVRSWHTPRLRDLQVMR